MQKLCPGLPDFVALRGFLISLLGCQGSWKMFRESLLTWRPSLAHSGRGCGLSRTRACARCAWDGAENAHIPTADGLTPSLQPDPGKRSTSLRALDDRLGHTRDEQKVANSSERTLSCLSRSTVNCTIADAISGVPSCAAGGGGRERERCPSMSRKSSITMFFSTGRSRTASSNGSFVIRRENNTVAVTKRARVIDRFLLMCQITKVPDADSGGRLAAKTR